MILAGFSILNNTPPLPTAKAVERPATVAQAPTKVIAWGVTHSQSYARVALKREGWNSTTQYGCLIDLWTKESNWRHAAYNKTPVRVMLNGKRVALHAGGIPQILGLDPKTHPAEQIDKGLTYIKSRYGSPCKAWAFWKKQAGRDGIGGWY